MFRTQEVIQFVFVSIVKLQTLGRRDVLCMCRCVIPSASESESECEEEGVRAWTRERMNACQWPIRSPPIAPTTSLDG